MKLVWIDVLRGAPLEVVPSDELGPLGPGDRDDLAVALKVGRLDMHVILGCSADGCT